MNEGNEIEIWYRYCELDKNHQYSVVCNEQPFNFFSRNLWIFWLWYRMGESLMKPMRLNEKRKFILLPYANTWDEKSVLIKKYKTVNRGVDNVIPAIQKHFNKVKHRK